MAIEKAKVLSALQLKFKGKSLTRTFLDKTATRYAAKIENDADLDDYINEREEDILAAGEEADRRVTAATKKLADDPTKKETKVEPEIDEDELKDAPPYVKALMKSLEGMKSEVAGLKAEKTQSTLQQRFLSDERLKGIDPKLLKGRFPTKEEDFETAITEAAEELKEYVKADDQQQSGEGTKTNGIQTKIGTAFGDKPVHAQVKTATAAEKAKTVPPEIKEFTEKLNKSATVSQTK